MLKGMQRSDLLTSVEVFHSKIPQYKQEEIASDLLNIEGTVKLVIATSALSMGFDAAGKQYIYNTHLSLIIIESGIFGEGSQITINQKRENSVFTHLIG